jgi:hypothetical protein
MGVKLFVFRAEERERLEGIIIRVREKDIK